MGAAYDQERGLAAYNGAKDLKSIMEFFGGRCCYCGIDLSSGGVNQDHLIPMNRTGLGLHAWGNVVPASHGCNAKKQGGDWKDFIIQRAGVDAAERHQRMLAFLTPSVEIGRKLAYNTSQGCQAAAFDVGGPRNQLRRDGIDLRRVEPLQQGNEVTGHTQILAHSTDCLGGG